MAKNSFIRSRNHVGDVWAGRRLGTRAAAHGIFVSDGETEVLAAEVRLQGASVSEPEDNVALIELDTGVKSLLNNSGELVTMGAVVVTDPTEDEAFTFAAGAGVSDRQIGIVEATIAAGEAGPVRTGGYARAIATSGPVVRGQFFKTSDTPGVADTTDDREEGSFGVALTGADPADATSTEVENLLIDSATTLLDTAGTSLVFDMPATCPNGSQLILALWVGAGSTVTTPTGWTRIGSTGEFWYYRRIASSEPTTYTANWSGSNRAVAAVVVLDGLDTAAVVEDFNYDSTSAAAAVSGLADATYLILAAVRAVAADVDDWTTFARDSTTGDPADDFNLAGTVTTGGTGSSAGFTNPTNANDDDDATSATSAGATPPFSRWLEADLGAPQAVARMELLEASNTGFVFSVWYSTDGIAWTSLSATRTYLGGNRSRYDFAETTAQYWRLLDGPFTVGGAHPGLTWKTWTIEAVPAVGGTIVARFVDGTAATSPFSGTGLEYDALFALAILVEPFISVPVASGIVGDLPDGAGGSGAEDAEGAIAIRYTFSTTTTDSDPGSGVLRLSNATQSSAVTARLDLADVAAVDVTNALDLIGSQVGTTKGYLRIQKTDDPTKWLLATVSAIASPSGYRNITIANIAKSANSPFADGDSVTVVFTPSTVGLALASAIVTDHGALTGLGDDDHTQYATNVEFDDHNARHEPGGADPMAVDAAQATGSLRTISTGAPAANSGAGSAGAGTAAAASTHAHPTTGLVVDGTAPSDLVLPSATNPTQTAEGNIKWDSDDDTIKVGDGAATKEFGYLGSSAPSGGYGTAASGSSKEVLRKDAVLPKPSILADVQAFPGGTTTFLRADQSFAPVTAGAVTFIGCLIYASAAQTVTAGAEFSGTYDSETFDTNGFHFTSAAALTGTVAKTAASAAIVGTGTSFTTELTVNQVISIPGTAAEIGVVKTITDNTHLTLWQTMANTASGQTATRKNEYIAIPSGLGGYYDCNARFYFGSTPGSSYGYIRKNGTGVVGSEHDYAATATIMTTIGKAIISTVAGDYFDIRALRSTGTTTGNTTGPASNMFQMGLLGQ